MTNPTITYDPEANALYLEFSQAEIAETVALSDSVYVDVDANGETVGIEILHATAQAPSALPPLPRSVTLRDLVNPHAA